MRAQTLDECFVITPRTVFSRHQFDQEVCDGWHLYAAEYCLAVESVGLPVYVLPLVLFHRSGGQVDRSYVATLDKIIRKHGSRNRIIRTGVGVWTNHLPAAIQWWRRGQLGRLNRLLRKLGVRNHRFSDLLDWIGTL